jgi:Inhibitor of vertebrate lysozyme (Ivy)
MQRQLRWVLVIAALTMSVVCSPAMAVQPWMLEPWLSDVVKKPAYARALKKLFNQTPNLPSWTREALNPKSAMIGTPLLHVNIDGVAYEMFKGCMPYNGDVSELVLLFAPNGTQAWGALVDKGPVSYLGAPSDEQAAWLRGSFSIDVKDGPWPPNTVTRLPSD